MRRSTPETVAAGDVRVDRAARRAWHGEEEIALSPREFDLLTFLVANAGRTVTRDQVMTAVWEGEWFGSPKTLDMHVARAAAQARRRRAGAAPRRHRPRRGAAFRALTEPLP